MPENNKQSVVEIAILPPLGESILLNLPQSCKIDAVMDKLNNQIIFTFTAGKNKNLGDKTKTFRIHRKKEIRILETIKPYHIQNLGTKVTITFEDVKVNLEDYELVKKIG